MSDLWVVAPVYNEESSIERFVEEWYGALRQAGSSFVFCLLNDGSTDATLSVLRRLEERFPELMVIDKQNSGHCPTFLAGYQKAVDAGARWVLQIDSDGQCDPRYFREFWSQRPLADAIYGVRRQREGEFGRKIISFFLAVLVFARTGRWIADPNVPYRLMRADVLKKTLGLMPPGVYLSNVFVAVIQSRQFGIMWVPIRFRARQGRPAGLRIFYFVREGVRLMEQLGRLSLEKNATPAIR
jgi:glycosyltransferase involved in cell wall biosynthesis